MLSIITTLLLFILIIGIVVMVHELGHFIAARLTGMKVEEFALGMGPKLWGRKRGDTEYMIKMFPIGGYVKILGEEERVKSKDSFSEKSVGQRVFVAVAGVIMNFLLAVLIFYITLTVQGFEYVGVPYYDDFNVVFGQQEETYAYPVTVVGITEGGNAEAAGLEAPFEILSVDGVEVENGEELKDEISSNAGGTVEVEIRHLEDGDGATQSVDVEVNEDGMIGVELAGDMRVWKLIYTGPSKVFAGFAHGVNMTYANVFVLAKLVGQSIEEKTVAPVATSVTGPVGLIAIIDIVKEFGGVLGILDLVALFSLALVLMNMLPFPALDGGHVVLLGIEAVRGKPVDEKVQQVMFGIGFAILMILMVLISAKDIFQFGVWDWFKGLFS